MTIFGKQKFVWEREIGGFEMDVSPVKQWRQDHDILQKDLAAEMGMSPSTLSQKENGHLDWNRSDLAFLKQEKGLSSDYVLGFQGSLNDEEVA
ncbi:helix-turn-helix domain-containing protein [Bifidobacterium dentium]|uniref:helix-turn-helix domain-containing protein n=1 Tax=Bifidobacterium dentium TaxID=1689 RepID=UPI003D1716BF